MTNTPAAKVWSTDDPGVLALWAELHGPAQERWREVADEVQRETGREIIVGSFDREPFGLTSTREEQRAPKPPAGWKWGNGDRHSGHLEPRASGPGSGDTRALLRRLREAAPRVRRRLLREYGVPETVFVGLRMMSPRVELMAGRLWVFFGTERDVPWHGGRTVDRVQEPGVFAPTTLADYFVVREQHERDNPKTDTEEDS